MELKNDKVAATRVIRWHNTEWAYVGEVAKSIGLTRSAFVKRAALLAAQAAEAGLLSYSVGGAIATPQNTRPNHFDRSIAQQGSGRNGGGGSRSQLAPEGITGPIPE